MKPRRILVSLFLDYVEDRQIKTSDAHSIKLAVKIFSDYVESLLIDHFGLDDNIEEEINA